jgi:hypothetical protein
MTPLCRNTVLKNEIMVISFARNTIVWLRILIFLKSYHAGQSECLLYGRLLWVADWQVWPTSRPSSLLLKLSTNPKLIVQNRCF